MQTSLKSLRMRRDADEADFREAARRCISLRISPCDVAFIDPDEPSLFSLPSGRYSLLGPDFHRQNRTSLRTHSITSSARASSDGGSSRPSAFAVLRLAALES
jgi:hypothetical protein